jgi:hypothetical protein
VKNHTECFSSPILWFSSGRVRLYGFKGLVHSDSKMVAVNFFLGS